MATYGAISTVTVGSSGLTSIEFTNIPQYYTDLLLKLSLRDSYNSSRGAINITFNGNSATSYSFRELRNRDASAETTTGSSQTNLDVGRSVAATSTSSTFSSTEIYIPNYTSSNYKSLLSDSVTDNNSSSVYYMNTNSGLWSNTAAITSIKIEPSTSWVQYSTATLYGIA